MFDEKQYKCVPQDPSTKDLEVENGGKAKESVRCAGSSRVWAGLIVASALVVAIIVDGVTFSFGILFIELLQAFGKGKGETAWIGSLMTCTQFVVGPLAAVAVTRYGSRSVAIAGGLVSFFGISSSFFCKELYQLYITFGCLGGLGFCLTYLSANVAVIQYFDRRRALAVGIASCGSGLGGIIFNPLANFLIETYGWRGTLLIEGALASNAVVCGLIFQLVQSSATQGESNMQNTPEKKRTRNLEENGTQHSDRTNKLKCETKENATFVEKAFAADDSVKSLEFYKPSDVDKSRTQCSFAAEVKVESNVINSEEDCNGNSHSESCTSEEVFECKTLFPFHLLRDRRCITFLLSTFFVNLGFTIPFNLLPDWAVDRGFSSSQAVYLVTALGIGNTAGRVLVGWLADKPGINRVMLYKGVICSVGLVTMLSPLYSFYWLLMVYACTFGALIGCYVTLCPVVLADMFGADLIAETMGLTFLLNGVAGLMATPIAGWIFDATGSYNISFINAGSEFLLGGLVLFYSDVMKRCSS